MTTEKPFRPNVAFLEKVEARRVMVSESHSPRRGGYSAVRGGEAAWNRHAAAGYVTALRWPGMMRSHYAELTDLGREALAKARAAQ